MTETTAFDDKIRAHFGERLKKLGIRRDSYLSAKELMRTVATMYAVTSTKKNHRDAVADQSEERPWGLSDAVL